MCLAMPNTVTKNLFEYVELPLPQISTTVETKHTLTLINHNQEKDSITNRADYVLDGIIDVHPISLELIEPIMIRTAKL
jgi:inorganic pyrophosphatase/exopolyphosphatase